MVVVDHVDFRCFLTLLYSGIMVGPTYPSKQQRLSIEALTAVLLGGNMTVYEGLDFFSVP